jgi:hypothetical protein
MNEHGIKAQSFRMEGNPEESWRPPAELTHSTPRSVCLSVQGIVVSCVAVLLIAGGVGLAIWLYLHASREHAFAQRMAAEGQVTSGEVTDVGPATGKDRRHKVTYRYEVDGKTYHAATVVGSDGAKGLKPGSGVHVSYIRSDPAQSWLVGESGGGLRLDGAGHQPKPTPYGIAPLVGVTMLLGPALIFLQIKRQRALLAEGRVALGHTAGGHWVSSGHGGHYSISYQFPAQDGKTYTGSFSGSKKKYGAVGIPVTILYDPDNPRRSTRHPATFVRIAED